MDQQVPNENGPLASDDSHIQTDENYWLHCIRQWYPNLQSDAHFLPPIHFNRVPYGQETVSGEQVLVVGRATETQIEASQPLIGANVTQDEAACTQNNGRNRDTLPLFSTVPPPFPVSDGDVRCDRAIERVIFCLEELAKNSDPKEVMMVISALQFGSHSRHNSYSYAAACEYFLPNTFSFNNQEGDFDVLIIHKLYGLFALEIKSVGEITASDDLILERVSQAVRQLEKAKRVLNSPKLIQKTSTDSTPLTSVTPVLVMPNINSSQLEKALKANTTIANTTISKDLCDCLGVQSIDDAVKRCLLSDQLSNKDTPWKVTSTVLRCLREWWQVVRSSGTQQPMSPSTVRSSGTQQPMSPSTVRSSGTQQPMSPSTVRSSGTQQRRLYSEVCSSGTQQPMSPSTVRSSGTQQPMSPSTVRSSGTQQPMSPSTVRSSGTQQRRLYSEVCSSGTQQPMSPSTVRSSGTQRPMTPSTVRSSGTQRPMTPSDYELLVARFCGPATTVKLHCVTAPRLNMRTQGEGVYVAGEIIARLVLSPEQVYLLNLAPPRVLVTGPPGTGKTVVLVLQGLKWLRDEHHVHIVSTWWGSRAVAFVIEHQLQKTIGPCLASHVHLHKFTLFPHHDMGTAVTCLKSAKGEGQLCVLMDEALYSKENEMAFQKFFGKLIEEVPDVQLWSASMIASQELLSSTSSLAATPCPLEIFSLTFLLRSPPDIGRLVMEAVEIGHKTVDSYKSDFPSPTDGLSIRKIEHNRLGHTELTPHMCKDCGYEIASFLKSLQVFVADSPLKFKDVLVLCNDDLSQGQNNPLVQGLVEREVPVHVVRKGQYTPLVPELDISELPVGIGTVRKDDEDGIRDMALGVKNVVSVTHWENVMSLERKVVFIECFSGVDHEKLHGFSRSSSLLVLLDWEPPRS